MPLKVTGKEKVKVDEVKNNESTKLSSTSGPSGNVKDILAKPELSPEDLKVLVDYIDKNHINPPKATDSELTKDINLDLSLIHI